MAAELHVLEEFDFQRAVAGHDYGAGQRANELRRRRRALEAAAKPAPAHKQMVAATKGDVARAFNRILGPRARRLKRELESRANLRTARSEPTRRALQAIEKTAGALELDGIEVGS